MKGRTNENTLQGRYLNDLRKQRRSVAVYLMSGVKQSGVIESFDQHTVLLRHGGSTQLVFKHMISTIMPAASKLSLQPLPNAQRAVSNPDMTAAPQIIRKTPRRLIKPDE